MSVVLPSLIVGNNPPVSAKADGSALAPFDSEVLDNTSNYQNLTGGPTLETPSGWDWFTDGVTTTPMATGVNDAIQQSDQNKTFAAAVLFGVAASGVAVFFVEMVGATQEERRTRRSQRSGDRSVS